RMTVREEPMPELFDAYARALAHLGSLGGDAAGPVLRGFECDLLASCGWWQGELPASPGGLYAVRDGMLAPCCDGGRENAGPAFSAAAAQAVFSRSFDDRALARETQAILQRMIDCHLGGRGLATRETLRKWRGLA
ncbi:MAG: DNA repair protein RecO C-terminal domain-containing protein, partial [Duodenibacillus sp.]|nr:DNA repair protein RecO C-terminal domain-containing protein [Duodenibacillus sp.]